MARPRNPKRDEAYQIWKASNGEKKLKDIAAELEVSSSQIRKWKNQDKWSDKMNGNVTKRKRGAPKGSKNALGNRGGAAPKGNANAVTHGLFAKHLPQETLDIVNDMDSINPLDILWMNIKMQFASILRAQKIMHVESKDEMIKELKKEKTTSNENMDIEEIEYEFQFAWDRQATFMNSLSRSMSELRSMLKQFYELANADDMRLLELEKMKLSIDKTKAEIDKLQDDDSDKPIEIMIKRKGEGS
ncbi:Uncharacterized protein YjcR [Gracilibacillus orientalis]|uniref:Uncharacterized protein YjcR n=1 Tax=Gracilibacillus orientalis TaxID=334253 RepID=A0A1I4PMJ4_9BACI|nr:phage terminase small subunit [Gracilibacillus orientalis]SFM28894.1 Uncharacterized protein YjcR [Gracilibacillus orientalis]